MKKGYYVLGTVLLGIGAYLLYNKIKNGNLNYNFRSEDNVVEAEEGSHLTPPKEAPDKIPSLATTPIAQV